MGALSSSGTVSDKDKVRPGTGREGSLGCVATETPGRGSRRVPEEDRAPIERVIGTAASLDQIKVQKRMEHLSLSPSC